MKKHPLNLLLLLLLLLKIEKYVLVCLLLDDFIFGFFSVAAVLRLSLNYLLR